MKINTLGLTELPTGATHTVLTWNTGSDARPFLFFAGSKDECINYCNEKKWTVDKYGMWDGDTEISEIPTLKNNPVIGMS